MPIQFQRYAPSSSGFIGLVPPQINERDHIEELHAVLKGQLVRQPAIQQFMQDKRISPDDLELSVTEYRPKTYRIAIGTAQDGFCFSLYPPKELNDLIDPLFHNLPADARPAPSPAPSIPVPPPRSSPATASAPPRSSPAQPSPSPVRSAQESPSSSASENDSDVVSVRSQPDRNPSRPGASSARSPSSRRGSDASSDAVSVASDLDKPVKPISLRFPPERLKKERPEDSTHGDVSGRSSSLSGRSSSLSGRSSSLSEDSYRPSRSCCARFSALLQWQHQRPTPRTLSPDRVESPVNGEDLFRQEENEESRENFAAAYKRLAKMRASLEASRKAAN